MLQKVISRKRRHAKVRSQVSGTAALPRLAIFRSNTSIYAQLIDDVAGKTLCSASSLQLKDKATKTEIAAKVGADIAKKAKKEKITQVVFDRGGFKYHGRVKALADAAREAGLQF